ncbi:hypothetical protein Back2_16350 [Nocardioides baekrokdamisoli]|uniref:L,D-TPase catalytic domain-containing protein n=2 Tax=Nocardioides baekrokdamisoli TaxID=1804624 RepID=A0A3G9J138_9ACTN|nr:hypothetical protein Back2_16350 [Nocardioides baekrokdamisoli]
MITSTAVVAATVVTFGSQAAGAAVAPVCGQVRAPGTTIYSNTSAKVSQVLLAHVVSGHAGWYNRFQWDPATCRWVKVGSSSAVFGSAGIIAAKNRVANDNKTPAGTFQLYGAFGVGNPGTTWPYTRLTPNLWWDGRQWAWSYNHMLASQSGCDLVNCEQLIRDTPAWGGYQYTQAVEIGYNMPVRHRYGGGSGDGIFLHYAHYFTTGCVGLANLTELTNTLRWLKQSANPRIVIN